jgi:gamma-glutamyltranspeptidase
VTVPGCVDGWFTLHEKFGRLPIGKVLQPAIGYAKEGVPIPQTIAEYWRHSVPILSKYPGFKEVFLPWGRAPREGDVFRNPALAKTLTRLVDGGRDAFYKGANAIAFGSMNADPLAGFGVILSAGLCVVLANATVRRIRDVASEE